MENLSIGLRNLSELQVDLGALHRAAADATEALNLAENLRKDGEVCDAATYLGFATALQARSGGMRRGLVAFARANALEMAGHHEGAELYSVRGTFWADILLRGGRPDIIDRTVARLTANRAICEEEGWDVDIAYCNRLLAEAAWRQNRAGDAAPLLAAAEAVFRRGMLVELARLHVTAGRVDLALNRTDDALSRAEQALSIAAPREMRLIHIDALILRGQVRLAGGEGERAADDGEGALRLALACSYGWGERDAQRLLSHALPPGQKQRAARDAAAALDDELTITIADLDAADAEAQAWLKQWKAGGNDA